MLIINDEELLEGLVGGFGWILAFFYLRNGYYKHYLNGTNLALVGLVSWCFLWYIRKISINLYREYKKIKNQSLKNLEIEGIDDKHKTFLILLIATIFLIVFYLLVIQYCNKSTQLIFNFHKKEIPFVLFIVFSIGLFLFLK